jgi:hypothetical protein
LGAGQSKTNDALNTVSRFVASRYPTADAAILAGSRARGEESSGSDYDVVLLFESLPSGAWREMTICEGQYIEVFAHDLGAHGLHRADAGVTGPVSAERQPLLDSGVAQDQLFACWAAVGVGFGLINEVPAFQSARRPSRLTSEAWGRSVAPAASQATASSPEK